MSIVLTTGYEVEERRLPKTDVHIPSRLADDQPASADVQEVHASYRRQTHGHTGGGH